MKKESKSAYELIPASLVFIKIALQLCAPKTPLVGVEGHKSERTQVNKGFLDEEDTEHFTEKCKERVRDNSHPHMPTQAGVSSPNEPTSPSGGSNVDLNFSDSNSTNVSNYELLQIFRKIDSGWTPEIYGFQKETNKFKEKMNLCLLVLNGAEGNPLIIKEHWTALVAQLRKSHDKLSKCDYDRIDIGLIHFFKKKETPQIGIGIVCCRNMWTVMWVKSITRDLLYENNTTKALSHWNIEEVAFCGYCPGGDLIKEKPNYILSKSLKKEFGEDYGEFQRAKFVKDANSEGVTLIFVPNEKLINCIVKQGMNFRISGGIRVYLEKHVTKSQSDDEIVEIMQHNEQPQVKVEI